MRKDDDRKWTAARRIFDRDLEVSVALRVVKGRGWNHADRRRAHVGAVIANAQRLNRGGGLVGSGGTTGGRQEKYCRKESFHHDLSYDYIMVALNDGRQ